MRILLDMNMSFAWLPVLKGAGYEAVHWLECGAPDAADLAIMDYAKSHTQVILTHDLDFGTLLSSRPDTSPSVIQLRSDNLTPQFAADVVLRTLVLARRELELGAIITIELSRVRLRILPLYDDH
jgi:predicted nuclease of predicted toxin-antitoxin system